MDTHSVLVTVVDDEEPVRSGLTRLLRSAGYETSAYPSGAEFLDSLELRHPDCVVLDLSMPGMTGHEVQSRMAIAGVHVPVVVITGHETPGVRERALQAGATRFLRKPVDDSDLLSAIEAAIRLNGSPSVP